MTMDTRDQPRSGPLPSRTNGQPQQTSLTGVLRWVPGLAVFRDYRDTLERQQQQMQRSLSPMTPFELRPTVRLRFTAAGTEAVIEYPVVLRQAAEIDEKLMRELMAAIDREPRLKLIGTEAAAVKLAA